MHDRKSPLETKFQLAILAETHDGMDGLSDISSIDWLRCKRVGDWSFDFYKDDAIVSSLNLENACLDLQDLLGIIVVGGTDAFEGIRDKWSSGLPASQIAFWRVPEWDSKAILGAAIECIAEDLRLHRSRSGRAALELSTYRREFDRLQRTFSRLEEYVGSQSIRPSTAVFEYPQTLESVTRSGNQAHIIHAASRIDRSLTQYLPVDSMGISGFSIYLSAKPGAAGTPLSVELRAIETDRTFGAWSLDADTVEVGWVELALSHAIDESALSLEVILKCPAEEQGWALASGPPHPYKEFCARTDEGEYLRAPIAMRILSNLPGIRVAPTTNARRPIDSPHVQARFVPAEAYESAVQVIPPLSENQPTFIFFDREPVCLTVHPRLGGLTAARMTLDVPPGAWGISAQIHLAHENASPTDFALMVSAPREEKNSLARLGQLDAPSPFFSGWNNLLPLEMKSIFVMLGASHLGVSSEEKLFLYLVTRQAPGASTDFGWARFSKFGFNVLPMSLFGGNSTNSLNPDAKESLHGGEEPMIEAAENRSDIL
jgi:hypothetical protein